MLKRLASGGNTLSTGVCGVLGGILLDLAWLGLTVEVDDNLARFSELGNGGESANARLVNGIGDLKSFNVRLLGKMGPDERTMEGLGRHLIVIEGDPSTSLSLSLSMGPRVC